LALGSAECQFFCDGFLKVENSETRSTARRLTGRLIVPVDPIGTVQFRNCLS
jgi:hypothetical protein